MTVSRKDKDYIKDIVLSIELIKDYIDGITKYDFITNQEKQDAVINRLMIIGEATKQISNHLREQFPNIPWKNMAGMRDILIHRYHGIDLEIVWEVINVDIAEVEDEIRNVYNKI